MAVDRFTRFHILRALWARAKTLMAWLGAPHEREARLRAWHWQTIQVAERHTSDGIVRSTGDPDSYPRLVAPPQHHTPEPPWQAQWEAQKRFYEDRQRQAQQLRQGR